MPFDTMTTPTAQIIDRAIKLIEGGWCKNRAITEMDGHRSYCLIGALNQARIDLRLDSNLDAVELVSETIPTRPGPVLRLLAIFNPRAAIFMRLSFWNDSLRRRKPEVIAVLRKAKETQHAVR